MRVTEWLWGRTPPARMLQLGLSPASLMFSAGTAARAAAYRTGWLRRRSLPLPTISIGNLSVGGTGKTPIAGWVAGSFATRGARPAILLRGYGGDEGEVHRRNVPNAIVIEDPDRARGAAAAAAAGAQVVILDDGFQHLAVRRDLDIVLLSTESLDGSRWRLPAGPWREAAGALGRAQFGIVTRRRATFQDSLRAADWMRSGLRRNVPVATAQLAIASFEGLWSGQVFERSTIRGAALLASAGIADPRSFGAQLRDLGGRVDLRGRRDHCSYSDRDIANLARAGQAVDFVVVTAKDAAKLRQRWPRQGREPLVARLEVCWETGYEQFEQSLARVWDGGRESR